MLQLKAQSGAHDLSGKAKAHEGATAADEGKRLIHDEEAATDAHDASVLGAQVIMLNGKADAVCDSAQAYADLAAPMDVTRNKAAYVRNSEHLGARQAASLRCAATR